jgi:hypothetical protein
VIFEKQISGSTIAMLIAFTAVFSLTGCDLLTNTTSDTTIDEPTEYHSTRHPLIPDAESLEAGLPDRTESEIIGTLAVNDMEVFELALPTKPAQNTFVDVEDYTYIYLGDPIDLDAMYTLYDNGTIPESFEVLFHTNPNHPDPNNGVYEIRNPLAMMSPRMPYMRIRYFFDKISQAEIPYGTSQAVTNSWTQGVETSVANSVTETLGIETAVEVGKEWPLISASASVTVSQEFSKTTTSTETVFAEESKSETVTFTPESEGTYLYATWQTVDVVEFVDADGNPWDVSDLGWEFRRALDHDGQNEVFGFVSRVPLSVDKRITKDIFY